jgi:hypothetical protein
MKPHKHSYKFWERTDKHLVFECKHFQCGHTYYVTEHFFWGEKWITSSASRK